MLAFATSCAGIETPLTRDTMKTSELLFPAEDGRFRTRSAIKKPFGVVAKAIGLKKQVLRENGTCLFNAAKLRAKLLLLERAQFERFGALGVQPIM
jgi:hypothetical protein